MRLLTIARRFALVALAVLLAGCEAQAGNVRHDEPTLRLLEGTRVALRTDVPEPQSTLALERLEKLEGLLDTCFPWLETPGAAPAAKARALLIADEARFRAVARSHGVMEAQASAFACSAGEVVLRYRAEEWGQGPATGWLQAPRSAAVSEAVFRRRLEASFGASLEHTLLEDGCARIFSERAARDLGEAREAARRERDDLLNAFLPVFLGSEHVLAKTASARGHDAAPRGPTRGKAASGPALAYAVARYLLEADDGRRASTVKVAFLAASHREGADDAWKKEREELSSLEDGFDRWLRLRTLDALLGALGDEPIPPARWEAKAAIRLIAAIEVEEEGAKSPEMRASLVARARTEIGKETTVRFLDEFQDRIARARDSRRPGELEALVKDAKTTLDDRARGYGHPALEEARSRMGQAVQERMREGS